jgi:NitT/TauT family transport system permease protein
MAATPTTDITLDGELQQELSGLDRLDFDLPGRPSKARRVWAAVWPKLAAIVIAVFLWQLVVWSGWKPTYLLPGPFTVFHAMGTDHSVLIRGAGTTLSRALEGYFVALVIGTLVAIAITRLPVLRTATTPLVTGLQTMPSVAWVPMAILLFGIRPSAILFVTVLGSAPALAIGTIAGIDAVPPILHRAGHVLGARGFARYRYVVLPGALPGYVTGMKQGWAFAWRSVMAAELIANIQGHPALGNLLSNYQDQSLAPDMYAVLVVVLIIGLVLDGLVFSQLESAVLRRRGLLGANI